MILSSGPGGLNQQRIGREDKDDTRQEEPKGSG